MESIKTVKKDKRWKTFGGLTIVFTCTMIIPLIIVGIPMINDIQHAPNANMYVIINWNNNTRSSMKILCSDITLKMPDVQNQAIGCFNVLHENAGICPDNTTLIMSETMQVINPNNINDYKNTSNLNVGLSNVSDYCKVCNAWKYGKLGFFFEGNVGSCGNSVVYDPEFFLVLIIMVGGFIVIGPLVFIIDFIWLIWFLYEGSYYFFNYLKYHYKDKFNKT